MRTNPKAWQNLVAAARRAPAAGGEAGGGGGEAPYGFSTRVAALGLERAGADGSAAAFGRLFARVFVVACFLAVGSVAVNFPALARLGSAPAEAAAVVSSRPEAGGRVSVAPSAPAAAGEAAPAAADAQDEGGDDPVAEVVNLAS